jgi:anti-anti-sigma regulatory factor
MSPAARRVAQALVPRACVSADAGRPEPGPWPPGLGEVPPFTPDLSLVVGRGLGTVVVTVDGDLNLAGSELLEGLLTDLIEGQGNSTVAVDLGRATVEPEAVTVLVDAARQARRRGTKFILKEPPAETHEALQSGEFADLVEVLPRRQWRR